MKKQKALEHIEGCPAERTESYPDHRSDNTPVTVTRCIDCGAHRVDEVFDEKGK